MAFVFQSLSVRWTPIKTKLGENEMNDGELLFVAMMALAFSVVVISAIYAHFKEKRENPDKK